MSSEKTYLPSSRYVELYAELAEAMLNESFYGEVCTIYETDDNGDERFTDEAQDLFNDYCGIVEKVLAKNNVHQEMEVEDED